jgi:hypothetical protein
MRRSLVLAALFLLCACDDKGKGPPGLTPVANSAAPSSSTMASVTAASVVASASGSASAAGACATLAKEKAERCTKMSGGDPTILTGCREAIDNLVKAADDAKCLKAMTPETEAPSDEPD